MAALGSFREGFDFCEGYWVPFRMALFRSPRAPVFMIEGLSMSWEDDTRSVMSFGQVVLFDDYKRRLCRAFTTRESC